VKTRKGVILTVKTRCTVERWVIPKGLKKGVGKKPKEGKLVDRILGSKATNLFEAFIDVRRGDGDRHRTVRGGGQK